MRKTESLSLTPVFRRRRGDHPDDGVWKRTRKGSLFNPADPTLARSLWPHQRRAFQTAIANAHVTINGPTASGKSTIIAATLGEYLLKHRDHRGLIVSPQTTTANSYRGMEIIHPITKGLIWFNVGRNLCAEPDEDTKGEALARFLRQREFSPNVANPHDIADRVLVCTYALFLQEFEKLQREPRWWHYFEKLTLVIDECHHIANANE